MVAEHKRHWLSGLVGEWTYEFSTSEGSYAATGTERVWAIGDNWIAAENKGLGSDGSPSHSLMTLGYNPENELFTGSFAGTMAPFLFIYEGDLSEDGKDLQLETEGPAMSVGREKDRYRDVLHAVDRDHRDFISEVRTEDGGWEEFMRTRYRRVA